MADRRSSEARLLTGVVLALTLALGACSSDPPSASEVRRQQVEERLAATFSKKQASCILGALDEPTMRALVRSTALDPESEAFKTYSNVVLLCANSDAPADGTTTTTAG